MQQLTRYEIDITLQDIKDSDGYLEFHKCGYPIYYAYNIIPDNGEKEQEYFEPVDIVRGSSSLKKSLEICPCCGEKLELRITGEYNDIDEIEEDASNLVRKYCENGDYLEFKILLEQIGIRLGLI